MTKTCGTCKLEKDINCFNKKGKLYQSACKPCKSKYFKEWREPRKNEELVKHYMRKTANKEENIKQLLLYLKEHSCLNCGETDPVVLEFDHRDPSTKEFDIGEAINNTKLWKTILVEIDKCDVLCANCHRRRTAQQFGWFKAKVK